MSTDQFEKTIAAIDKVNLADPNLTLVEGREVPKELLYAQRMTEMLLSFQPDASETLRIAARSQHIGRWEIQRSDYKEGKVGYHRWRNALKKIHAQKAEKIMSDNGYEHSTIKEVSALIQKKELKENKSAQTLEDVICLVFLKYYLSDFSKKHPEKKVVGILKKTWTKMSENAHSAALDLNLDERPKRLLHLALNS